MTSPSTRLRRRLAAAFAIANGLSWLGKIATTQPLPLTDFADRQPTVIWSETGVQFNMCHDCSSMLVLAGRDFGLPWHEDGRFIALVIMANPIGLLASAVAVTLSEGLLGYWGAMWLGTAAFLAASTVQWWGFGWLMATWLNRRLKLSGEPKGVAS